MSLNDSPLDSWSLVHTLMGVGVGAAGVEPLTAGGGAVAFDVVEHLHEYPAGSQLFGSKAPESLQNVLGDLVVYGLGYAAGRRLRGAGEAPVLTVAAFGAAALVGMVLAHRAGCQCPTVTASQEQPLPV